MTLLPPKSRPGSVAVYGESQPAQLARAKARGGGGAARSGGARAAACRAAPAAAPAAAPRGAPNAAPRPPLPGPQGYPYPRPSTSFVFVNSPRAGAAWHALAPGAWRGADNAAGLLDLPVAPAPAPARLAAPPRGGAAPAPPPPRSLRSVLEEAHGIAPGAVLPAGAALTPILAIGSNAAPEQLVGGGGGQPGEGAALLRAQLSRSHSPQPSRPAALPPSALRPPQHRRPASFP
jgi:hypothetical protein